MSADTQVVSVSTIDIVRAAWPIVTFVIGLIWAQINVYFRLQTLVKEHDHFKNTQYEKDKTQLLDAIKKVAESQEKSEQALESELKQLRAAMESKLEKISEQMLKMSIQLAEINARSYPKTKDTSTP